MNTFVFAMLVACATAQYTWPYAGYYGRYAAAPYVAAPYAWAAPVPLANQYHSQDVLGQASYGYSYPGAAASNFRDAAGNQVGSYAYINPEGKEVKVSYTAGVGGFKVLSNDLPVAPVFDGKAPVFDGKAPEPVQDTPEVAAAKAEHFKLLKESKREKRQIWSPYASHFAYTAPVATPVAYHAPIAYSAPVVAKSTVNTLVYEKTDEKTPADTNKLTEKVLSHEVYTPVAAAPYYHSVYPATYPAAYQWAYPNYPVAAIAADKPKEEEKEVSSDDDSIKVESARKKRQVVAFPYNYVANHKPEEFKNDFDYSSVDLNQDGQPDNKPFYYPYAYNAYPYNFGYSAYPFVY